MIDLARIAREVTREVDPRKVLQVITEQAVSVGAISSWLFRCDPEARRLVRVAGWNLPKEVEGQTEVLSVDDPTLLVAKAARTGIVQTVDDLDGLDSTYQMARRWIVGPGGKRMVVVPLIAREQTVGVMAWIFASRNLTTAEEEATYRIMGEFFALAILNAEDHRLLTREVEERKKIEREREKLLAAVEKERLWLRFMIERSPVAVVMTRPGGQVLSNAEAEKLLGAPIDPTGGMEQFAGRIRLPSGRVLGKQRPLSWDLASEPLLVNREVAVIRADGTEVPVFGTLGFVQDDRGRLVGGVGILQDMRPIKEIERMREEWASLIAHDLRQPVTVIQTQAALLARKSRDGYTLKKLHHITSSAKQMNRMIADLLDASLLEARRLKLQPAPTDLRSLMDRLLDKLEEDLDGREVRVRWEGELAPVHVDPSRAEQVFSNLLTNAIKYSYPRTPICLEGVFKEEQVEVRLSNEGEGIAPEHLDSIFERFQRGGREASTPQNAGLGLYISKALVEAHGGRIWAESVPKGETTFWVVLPARAGEEPSSR